MQVGDADRYTPARQRPRPPVQLAPCQQDVLLLGDPREREAALERLLSQEKPELRLLLVKRQAPEGAREAYQALLEDSAIRERLLRQVEKSGVASPDPRDQVALMVLGSARLPAEDDARLRALAEADMEQNHGWSPVDDVVDVYRVDFQNRQLRQIGEGPMEVQIGAAREFLRTVIHRVIPSSLEYQTRPPLEKLKRCHSQQALEPYGEQLLEEFREACRRSRPDLSDLPRSAMEALWVAHGIGARTADALKPYMTTALHPKAAPVNSLVGDLRWKESRELELKMPDLEAAQRLIDLKRASGHGVDEVYERFSQALPANHWLRRYSEDPRERFEAARENDPLVLELRQRLGEHAATMKAVGEARRWMEQGVAREQAIERALLGYLVGPSPGPGAGVAVNAREARVGGVRIRNRSATRS